VTILVARKRIRNEFKAILQNVFKLLRKKAAPLGVFLYKLKKISITQITLQAEISWSPFVPAGE